MMLTVQEDGPDLDWTQPGVYKVADGVYRIPLPLPHDSLRAVNVYLIESIDGVVLVDAGWALVASEEALNDALLALQRDFTDIEQLLVTHSHRDHFTQAITIRRQFGTPVAIGRGEQLSLTAMIERPGDMLNERLERLVACGASSIVERLRESPPAAVTTPTDIWELPDHWLNDRQEVVVGQRSLTCIETPGHTRGHMVFHDNANGLLFAGDHLLPHITPSIGFERVPSVSPLRDYLASLRLIRSMPLTRLLPAHGPVAPSSHDRAEEILSHHEARLEATKRALDRGASTPFEVASLLTWTRRQLALDTMDDFSQQLAVFEAVAHLDVLVESSQASRSIDDGVMHYS
jgi:glyoxylase-like metal-dependent hydrolase (beta-lactamase superfamily II)